MKTFTSSLLSVMTCLISIGCIPYVKVNGGVPSISGHVSDSVTNKPVANAQLTIPGYSAFYTNEMGIYDIPAKWDWAYFRAFTPAGIIDYPGQNDYSEFMQVSHPNYKKASVSRYGPDPVNRQDFRQIRLTLKNN